MSGYTFRQFYIPGHMMESLRRYIDQGIAPGHFLTAVLEHDLFEAVGRADDENLANLPAYVAYLYNDAPSNCHGSREKACAGALGFAVVAAVSYVAVSRLAEWLAERVA